MDTKTTGEVAAALGTTECRVQELIRYGKVKRPEKVRGRRRWTKENEKELRAALARNS